MRDKIFPPLKQSLLPVLLLRVVIVVVVVIWIVHQEHFYLVHVGTLSQQIVAEDFKVVLDVGVVFLEV